GRNLGQTSPSKLWKLAARPMGTGSRAKAQSEARNTAAPKQLMCGVSGENQRGRVFWLVDANLAPAWQLHFCDAAPPFFVDRAACDVFLFQFFQHRRQIVTHKVEFMPVVLVRGMEGSFRSRHGKDQPAASRVH